MVCECQVSCTRSDSVPITAFFDVVVCVCVCAHSSVNYILDGTHLDACHPILAL